MKDASNTAATFRRRPPPSANFRQKWFSASLLRFFRFLLPKGMFCWSLAAIFLFLLVKHLGKSLLTFGVLLFVFVLVALFTALSKIVPSTSMDRIEMTHPLWRILVLAPVAYLIVSALVALPEARSFRSLWEPIFLRGGAPFSAVNVLGICGAIVAAGTQMYVRRFWVQTEGVRGSRLITHEEAIKKAEKALELGSDGFVWGGVRLSMGRGREHFLIVGESGSGKTTTILTMLKSVLHSIKKGSNSRAIVFDPKRDLFSMFATFGLSCPVQTLHPFDKRGYAWDMAKDIHDPLVAIEIATILVPEKAGEQQPYFPNAARMLLSGVMESFLRVAPGKWTLRDVVLALRYPKRVREILKMTPDTEYLTSKFASESQGSADIASTLEIVLRRLSFVAAAWEDAGEKKISLEDWAENGESVLLLGRSPAIESTLQELNRAILFRLTQLILELPNADRVAHGPPRQTWVVIDELRDAGRMDQLHTLLVEGRSKGASVVLGFQDVPGLHDVYGENLAKELSGLCGNKAFLRTTEPTTQKYASECLGDEDIDLPRVSTSRGAPQGHRDHVTLASDSASLSYERISRPLVLPSQFASDLPRPSAKVGISGYYMTAAVGDPYFANISGDDVNRFMPPPDTASVKEGDEDFTPRYPPGSPILSLKEWSKEDLKRLNLETHPELLETESDRAVKPTNKEYKEALDHCIRPPGP